MPDESSEQGTQRRPGLLQPFSLWGQPVKAVLLDAAGRPAEATPAQLWPKLAAWAGNPPAEEHFALTERLKALAIGGIDHAGADELLDLSRECLAASHALRSAGCRSAGLLHAASRAAGVMVGAIPRTDRIPNRRSAPSWDDAPRGRRTKRVNERVDVKPRERRESQWIAAARTLLRGRSVVMIGGEPDPQRIQAMSSALNVEVLWPRLREHGRADAALGPIRHSRTAAVVILRRLAGHLHIDLCARWAEENQKAVVKVTSGIGIDSIAQRICQQASRQLHQPLEDSTP